jgi:hypothetical protein
LIREDLLPAKTVKNLKNRVANLRHRCKGNKVNSALIEYRSRPLSAEEVVVVREGIKEHGLRWLVISKKCLPSREGLHLQGLWNGHISTNEEDKVLTESIQKYGPELGRSIAVTGSSSLEEARQKFTASSSVVEDNDNNKGGDGEVVVDLGHGDLSYDADGGDVGYREQQQTSSPSVPKDRLPLAAHADAREGGGGDGQAIANASVHGGNGNLAPEKSNVDYRLYGNNINVHPTVARGYPEQQSQIRQQKLITQEDLVLDQLGNHVQPLPSKENGNERWDNSHSHIRSEISLQSLMMPPPPPASTKSPPNKSLQQQQQQQNTHEGGGEDHHTHTGGKWCRQFDRALLNSVKVHGACSSAFVDAWHALGAQQSPFSVEDISERYARLCQIFGYES